MGDKILPLAFYDFNSAEVLLIVFFKIVFYFYLDIKYSS